MCRKLQVKANLCIVIGKLLIMCKKEEIALCFCGFGLW